MDEVWRNINGYEGYYQISNIGRVKSLERRRYNGSGYYVQKVKILRQSITTTGYIKVELSKEGTKKSMKVHRLVAIAFIENPENKPDVNHKDGNPFNNNLSNLEWCTESENLNHAVKIGLKKTFKINKEVLVELYINQKLNPKEIGLLHGVSNTTIIKQLKKYRIPIRDTGEARVRYNITKEMLDEELLHKSQTELAKELGCDVSLISYYYNLFKKKGA